MSLGIRLILKYILLLFFHHSFFLLSFYYEKVLFKKWENFEKKKKNATIIRIEKLIIKGLEEAWYQNAPKIVLTLELQTLFSISLTLRMIKIALLALLKIITCLFIILKIIFKENYFDFREI